MRGQAARHADPDFVPSLRLLVQRERYSHADIALMFGVSRERVRQWCDKYDIEHPDAKGRRGLMCVRVWDDLANRFQPVSRAIVTKATRRLRSAERRAAIAARIAARREHSIRVVRALYERVGRDLTLQEMACAIKGRFVPINESCVHIAQGMGRGADVRGAAQELRDLVGMKPRRAGGSGHLSKSTNAARRLSPGGESQTARNNLGD